MTTTPKTRLDVIDLVREGLRARGYDGLWNPYRGCACCLDDEGLAPCGDIEGSCEAGYRVEYGGNCPGGECDGGCDYHIQPTRDRKKVSALDDTEAAARARDAAMVERAMHATYALLHPDEDPARERLDPPQVRCLLACLFLDPKPADEGGSDDDT